MPWTPVLPWHAPRRPRSPPSVVEVRGDLEMVGVDVAPQVGHEQAAGLVDEVWLVAETYMRKLTQ